MKYILVQEEYGFRHWIGEIRTSEAEIITWWKSLKSVKNLFLNPSNDFIVPLIEMEDIADDEAELAKWKWVKDGQEFILNRSDVAIFMHLHEDYDSYLKIPKGDFIHHAGYCIY